MESEVMRPSQASTAGSDSFATAAMYECWPGGPIVSKPSECREIDRSSPNPSGDLQNLGFPNLTIG